MKKFFSLSLIFIAVDTFCIQAKAGQGASSSSAKPDAPSAETVYSDAETSIVVKSSFTGGRRTSVISVNGVVVNSVTRDIVKPVSAKSTAETPRIEALSVAESAVVEVSEDGTRTTRGNLSSPDSSLSTCERFPDGTTVSTLADGNASSIRESLPNGDIVITERTPEGTKIIEDFLNSQVVITETDNEGNTSRRAFSVPGWCRDF